MLCMNKKKQEITSIPRLEFKQNQFVLAKDNRQSTTKGLLKKHIIKRKNKNINN